MKAKNIFRRAAYGLKYGTFGAVGGTLVASIAIPALGLLAHCSHYVSAENLHNDYSIKNRFETAYSFNTPEEHKYYHTTPIVNGYSQETIKEYYAASPWATYGATAALGIMGAVAMGCAGVAMAKEKER